MTLLVKTGSEVLIKVLTFTYWESQEIECTPVLRENPKI